MFALSLRAALSAAALLPGLAAAAPLSLESALNLAVQRSESSRAARAAISGARETAHAAGQLPDPTLRFGVDNLPVTGADRFSTTRDSMTMKRIGISQEWLSKEKRDARLAAAQAVVGRESIQLQMAIADTRLQTSLAYLDALFASKALELTTLTAHHAHEEQEAARARLASSNGNSQDALALAAARGVADDESAEAIQQQRTARIALQRWTGQASDEFVPLPAFPLPTQQAYVDANPSVQAMQHDLDVAQKTAAATATNRSANWTWEVAYGQRTGYSDMVSIGASIPLQWAPAERQDRETAAKLALVDKAQAELAEATRAATAEYRALSSNAERLQARVDSYRTGVVSLAEQRTAAAMAAYRSNQASLPVLFEARRAEVDAQRKLLALQRELARTQAQLAFRPLDLGALQ